MSNKLLCFTKFLTSWSSFLRTPSTLTLKTRTQFSLLIYLQTSLQTMLCKLCSRSQINRGSRSYWAKFNARWKKLVILKTLRLNTSWNSYRSTTFSIEVISFFMAKIQIKWSSQSLNWLAITLTISMLNILSSRKLLNLIHFCKANKWWTLLKFLGSKWLSLSSTHKLIRTHNLTLDHRSCLTILKWHTKWASTLHNRRNLFKIMTVN